MRVIYIPKRCLKVCELAEILKAQGINISPKTIYAYKKRGKITNVYVHPKRYGRGKWVYHIPPSQVGDIVREFLREDVKVVYVEEWPPKKSRQCRIRSQAISQSKSP
ncbi:hypothetical protein DRP04_14320 [Archaeoglobales archaeon]|nr:MAG: hypothetical protein DRP04_14320 [Archaeoglobales archaeon]